MNEMAVNENEMSLRRNNKAWSVLESGLQRYQSWDSSWCSYVKQDLKLRGFPAASTIRPTCALRTIAIIFSQKEWQGLARPVYLFCISGPTWGRGPPGPCRALVWSNLDDDKNKPNCNSNWLYYCWKHVHDSSQFCSGGIKWIRRLLN